jgi:hypothetical protein
MDAGIAFAGREKSETKEQMGSESDCKDVMYEEFLRKIGQQFDCDEEIKIFLKKKNSIIEIVLKNYFSNTC